MKKKTVRLATLMLAVLLSLSMLLSACSSGWSRSSVTSIAA